MQFYHLTWMKTNNLNLNIWMIQINIRPWCAGVVDCPCVCCVFVVWHYCGQKESLAILGVQMPFRNAREICCIFRSHCVGMLDIRWSVYGVRWCLLVALSTDLRSQHIAWVGRPIYVDLTGILVSRSGWLMSRFACEIEKAASETSAIRWKFAWTFGKCPNNCDTFYRFRPRNRLPQPKVTAIASSNYRLELQLMNLSTILVGQSCLSNEICVGIHAHSINRTIRPLFMKFHRCRCRLRCWRECILDSSDRMPCKHTKIRLVHVGWIKKLIGRSLCARVRSAHTSSGRYRNQLSGPSEARYRSNNGTTTAICGICAIPFALCPLYLFRLAIVLGPILGYCYYNITDQNDGWLNEIIFRPGRAAVIAHVYAMGACAPGPGRTHTIIRGFRW